MGTNPEGSRDLGGHAGTSPARGAEEASRPLTAVPPGLEALQNHPGLHGPRTGATYVPPEPPARTGETVLAPPEPVRTGSTVVPPAPVRTGSTVVPPAPVRTGSTVVPPAPEQPVAAAPFLPPRSFGVPAPGAPPLLGLPPLVIPIAPGLPPGVRPPPSLLAVPPPSIVASADEPEDEEQAQDQEQDEARDDEGYGAEDDDPPATTEGAAFEAEMSDANMGAFDSDGELEEDPYGDGSQDELQPDEDVSTGDYPDEEDNGDGEQDVGFDGEGDEEDLPVDEPPLSRNFADDLTRHTAAPISVDGPRFVSVGGIDSFGDPEDFAVTGGRRDEERGETPTSADGMGGGGGAGSGGGAGKSGNSHPKRDALFGQVLADRYRVLDLIGKGGMGKVYLAEHVALGKKVAVKVLNPAYTHRPDQVKRFLREAQAASTIGHENVIDITDFGEMANGSVFFAMEHLAGEDLGKLLKRNGALNWPRARRIVLQMCRALQAAHARGIIHRDMKPENCFIIHRNGMRDFVKVLDFGIAKFLEENRQNVAHTLTQAGALIGTPEYMAPEQVQGEAADVRMDIYALGCIMYQLLTGQLPFSDKTMFGVLSQQVNVKPVPPRQLAPEADIPVEVEAIILKAMEKERSARFQTMAELIEALVAAPRGTSDGRGGTTSNLEAAASAARMAAAMNAAAGSAQSGQNQPFSVSPTPSDMTFAPGSGGRTATDSTNSAHWPEVGRDPAVMTKVVIALVAAVLVLVVGLVCALTNKTDDPSKTEAIAGTTAPRDMPPVVEPVVVPDPPPTTPPETPPDPTAAAGDDEGLIIDDDPVDPTKVPTKKDPVKTTPRKDTPKKDTPKKDPKVENLPEPTLEKLEPMDLNRVLTNYKKDVEACRAAKNGPRGVVAVIKLKIEGGTGRVLEATPTDTNVAAPCIAKFVKSRVKFPRFKLKVQDLNARFPM